MAFEATRKTVYDLLNDISYNIPINQRKYVWKKNNWEELFDDINLIMENSSGDHFLGSVVLNKIKVDDNIKNHCSIVDGQQRIITLTIAISAIGFLFAELNAFDSFEGLTKNLFVKNSKGEEFPIVSKNCNKDVFNLVNCLRNNVIIRKSSNMPMVTLHELVSESRVSKLIDECFTFYYNKFKTCANGDTLKLESFLKSIQDMKYINIIADNQEDAYSIFEVLNARGQPLMDFDLLSNYILKCFSNEKKNSIKEILECIKDLVDNEELFLKHYVTHKYGKKSDKDENRAYKLIVKNEKNKNKVTFLEDLLKKAQYYNKIISYQDCTALEKKVFSFFKPRRQQQFRPLVMGLMHQLDLYKITQDEYDSTLMFLYEFFIYFNVIGEQTSNKIEDIVYGYSYKIENEFDKSLLKKFKKSMAERVPESKEDLKNYLNNLKYSNQFKPFSGSKKRENVIAILEIIEREKNSDINFDEFDIEIEHIYPDSQSTDNSRLGNLILLEKELNEKCKNKPLIEKIQFYKQSKFSMVKEIADDCQDFNIDERLNRIVEAVYEIIQELKK